MPSRRGPSLPAPVTRPRFAAAPAAAAALALVLLAAVLAGCSDDGAGPALDTTAAPEGPASASEVALAVTAPAGGGPVAPASAAVGHSTEHTVRGPDGQQRHYRLYVPTSLPADGEAVPLVLALHGGTGWGAQFERQSRLDDLAESNGFLVAYPDGEDVALPGPGAVWNAGGCCGPADTGDERDVHFLAAVLDDVGARQRVDPDRILATGHSNGAMMALRLACELGERIAAVAVQSGPLFVDRCEPARPVSVLAIHGDADPNVPLEGGRGPRSVAGVDFPPALAGMRALAAADGCLPEPTDTVAGGSAAVVVRVWSGCRDGTTVAFATVPGAAHGWMGAPSRAAQLTGVTSYAGLDASVAVWSFLSTHGR